MYLLDLAPEIIEQIIDWSMPLAFESFVLSCKTIHSLAAPKISLHNDLKRKWKYTRIESHRSAGLQLLHSIAAEPLVARYIESIDLWSRKSRLRLLDYPEPADVFGKQEEDCKERIRAFLFEESDAAQYFEDSGVDVDEWWSNMQVESSPWHENEGGGRTPHTDIAILLLLPNVQVLRLSRTTWGDMSGSSYYSGVPEFSTNPFWRLLDRLVHRTRGRARSGRALGNLKTVLPFMYEGYNERGALESLQSFMQLPSVTEVYAVSCIACFDGYTGKPFSWRLPAYACNIRRLELAFCCMDRDGICIVVSQMPHLEILKYGHDSKWHGCQFEWNAALFLESVAKHCGERLTELAISCVNVSERQGIPNGISSFHEFLKLEKLEVDARVFCGPPLGIGHMRGMCGYEPEGAERWIEDQLPCLATILPPSLAELHVNIDYEELDDAQADQEKLGVDALLNNFKAEKGRNCPKLERVVFRQFRSDTAKKLVEDEGCKWESYDIRKTRMPLWLRQFQDVAGDIGSV